MLAPRPLRPGIPTDKSLFVNVRGEVDKIFDGDLGVAGFSFSVILRHQDKKQRAAGYNALKGEATIDGDLANQNIVFQTTDRFVEVVKKKILGRMLDDMSGIVKENIGIFYFKWNEAIVDQDIIIEIPVDDHGNPTSPVRHLKKYQVKDVERIHGNDGRVEYLSIYSEWIE